MDNATQKKYLSFKEILIYSVGLFGLQMVIFYLNSYQVEFYSTAGRLTTAELVAVPFLILAAKIVSAIFDPIVGNLIERKPDKGFGKLKPFVLYAAAPLVLFTVLLFVDVPISGAALLAYIFVITTLWSMAMTMADVPSQAMSAVLTPNPTERTNLIGFSGTFRSIGQAAPYVVVPVICLIVPGGAGISGTLSVSEYLWNALGIGIIGTGMLILICFFNKERVPYKAEKMNFRQMFSAIKSNKYLMLVMISYFLGCQAGCYGYTGTGGKRHSGRTEPDNHSGNFYRRRHDDIHGFDTTSNQKIGRKKGVCRHERIRIFILAVGVLCRHSHQIPPGRADPHAVFDGVAVRRRHIMPMVMVADSVDYYEYKTGKRTEGVAFAVLSFSIKVTLALGSAVCLAVVFSDAVGYTATTEEFSFETSRGVYFAYTVIPGITSLLAAIPILFYDLTGKKKADIAEALRIRRSAAAETAEAAVADTVTDTEINNEVDTGAAPDTVRSDSDTDKQ